jgi:uncharacterized lipoprotein YddW (UPF0748 family)
VKTAESGKVSEIKFQINYSSIHQNMINRREFIKNTSLLGLGLAAGSSAFLSCSKSVVNTFPIKNWVWITPEAGLGTDKWKERFEFLRKNNIQGAVVQIYSSHKAWFESPYLPMQEPLLEKLIEAGKETGIEVHAWMWTMPNNNPHYVENHPEFYAVNGNGQPAHTHPAYVGYYRFMCPNQPGVREFLRRNVETIASHQDLHGVHFDYIRLPDVIIAEALQPVYKIVQDREFPEYDYCYCEVCRDKFSSQTGIDPLRDLQDPSASEEWRKFRQDSITGLVNDLLIPTARKHQRMVSAAVFPNWESVRQQWSQWDMDAYFPMLYHNFYNADLDWIGQHLEKHISELKKPVPVYSGLFLPALPDQQLRDAINISLNAGASGISIFSYHQMKDHHWNIMKEMI